tara:strand:- start:259 stop:1920 length:1662 start_codon:yes stop_codon:yes gene_type:complete
MSKLTSLIRRAPKRFSAVIAMIAAAIIVPAVVFAWGPSRPTFTVANPANYITFNSITDNPVVGDERNFVVVKDAANTNDGGWQDNITVQPGKEYLVRVYVHNNANANLNLTALNTRVMASVPNTTGKNVSISGFVTADNATPNQVWDDIHFNSSKDFNLTYVPGSAEIYNNGYAAGGSGKSLPDSIVTSQGALVGYNGPDGKVPGCFQYVNYVYFKVKPQFPTENFTVNKDVRKDGDSKFVESVNAKPGDTLNYRITYKNTGNVQANNVILKDMLPEGVSFVPGSVKIMNANNLSGAFVKDGDNLFSSGINIGSYTAGSNALVIFDAKVAKNDNLPKCGTNTLVNTASAQPQGQGTRTDDAKAVVNKECKPVVKYTCDSLSIKTLSTNKFRFTTNYTVENATFKRVTYVVKDASGKVVDTKTSTSKTLDYEQKTAGKYTVQATITVSVNGTDKTATSDGCKGVFEVPKNPGEITVCELATKQIVTIKEDQFNPSKYSKNLDDCKETPVTPVTPVTPSELPQTGAGDGIVAIVGLGAMIASVVYYIASRRALGQ